jgi:hypothetical protein
MWRVDFSELTCIEEWPNPTEVVTSPVFDTALTTSKAEGQNRVAAIVCQEFINLSTSKPLQELDDKLKLAFLRWLHRSSGGDFALAKLPVHLLSYLKVFNWNRGKGTQALDFPV